MSKYTTEVRYICESLCDQTTSSGYNRVNEIIQQAIPKIFDFDFPIYDETYRNVLCAKILKHYYTREIGAETVGLWKLWLDTKLNEIMPYYNQLYKSAILEFDPLLDVDYTTTYTKQNDGTTNVTENSDAIQSGESENSSTVNSNSVDRSLYADTPQGALDNLENETYLTNATKNMSDSTGDKTVNTNYSTEGSYSTTGQTVANTTEEYIQHITGKTGGVSYSKRVIEFRKTFLNIDVMIIDELNDLFMNLW